ncbi:MAG TPA: DUF4097 family beta strand repeat-containing protein [Elusimicrobiales bacterium]|nr:DUF4097 family beta strand repeat-containing protein [Elusimicrobiales bacterium]
MKNAVAVIFAMILAGSTIAKDNFKTFTKSFNADKIDTVEIETGSADVNFNSGIVKKDGKGKVVQVKLIRFEEDKCDLTIEPGNGKLFIEIKSKRKHWINFSNSCQADLEIEAPRNTAFEIRGGSSDIRGAHMSKNVSVKVGSGDIELVDISGDLRLKSGSGDIDLVGIAGYADVSTGSGDITLANVKGNVKLSTGSGDIEGVMYSNDVVVSIGSGNTKLSGLLGSLRHNSGSGSLLAIWDKPVIKGEVSLKKGSGDTELYFPKGSKIDVDIRTGSGRVRNEFGFSPGNDFIIHGKTGSGDIYIGRKR